MILLPLTAVFFVANFVTGAPDLRCLRTTTLRWKKFADYISRFYKLYLEAKLHIKFDDKDLVIGYRVALNTTRTPRPGYVFAGILSYNQSQHPPVYLKFISKKGTYHFLRNVSSNEFMDTLYECKVNGRGIV